MRAISFGNYAFPTSDYSDEWFTVRPERTAQVSGASGVHRYFNASGDPIGPTVVKKHFVIVAATRAALDTALMALRKDTIAAGPQQLRWQYTGTLTDGTVGNSTLYMHDVVCRQSSTGKTRGNGPYVIPVDLEFFSPYGVWFASSAAGGSTAGFVFQTGVDPNPYTWEPNFGSYPTGNLPAPLLFEIYSFGAVPGAITGNVIVKVVDNATGAVLYTQATYSGGITVGNNFVINSRTYSCTNTGTDDYANLTLPAGQLSWLMMKTSYTKIIFELFGHSDYLTIGAAMNPTYVF